MSALLILVILICVSTSSCSESSEFDIQEYFRGTNLEEFMYNVVDLIQTNRTRCKRSLTQLLGTQTLLSMAPPGTVFITKYSIDMPVEGISYASSFRLDAITTLKLDTFVLQLKRRKKRGTQLPLEAKKDLMKRKKKEKLDFYKQLEEALESYGIPSRACLLRTICEIAEAPIVEGLLGELLNWALSARLSDHQDDDNLENEEIYRSQDEYLEFFNADKHGRKKGQCQTIYSECNKSVFDIIPSSLHFS